MAICGKEKIPETLEKPRIFGISLMVETAGLEPVTSCV